ncbi:dTMP kinase [Trichothermofontia sp.]
MGRGKLIVFEGIDGVGKTTQLQRLQAWLPTSGLLSPGQEVHCTYEPGATNLGQYLRRCLLAVKHSAQEPIADRAELLLYAADRAQHVAVDLKPRLERGEVILCDRYADSTVAYQGCGRGLDLDLIRQVNAIATAGLVSDLTLWLDLDYDCARERSRLRRNRGEVPPPDRIEQAARDFHERVRQGFEALWQAHPDRIVRIDASGDEAAIAAVIQQVVRDRWLRWA